ncbi:cytochrome P450 [Streptomyces sp. HNM0575]|uniref:cytochrome P450 n=1 Tax=Streptomyces sp. HNM0575 TaxID=2716338 RepID=UPI00145C8E5C|nr:cytochrome P450 [Streptomyces sp. HNM0575]NLU76578.1 cytochrome P450 [Streptomyces sp. HNM0575]
MTETTEETGLFQYPQWRDPADPLTPPPAYLEVQEKEPLTRVMLPSGRTTWLITGQDLGRQILTEPDVSVDRTNPAYPFPVPNPEAVVAQLARWTQILLGDDPPLHTARRRMLITEFTVRRAQAMRPRIQEIVDAAIDDLVAAGPPADLVKHVALSVPSLVICELLGVPYEDHEFFQTRTMLQLERDVSVAEQKQAIDELLAYFEVLISKKEEHPEDDLLSRLIVNNREKEAFDHEALVALGLLLLVGGHETTGNVIALGTAAMLNDPEQFAALKEDPSLMPSAVEEFLRYFSPATATNRVATADIDLDGTTIKAGEGMIVHLTAMARDARVFPDPQRLDVRRNPKGHMAFSHGIHQCMGQNLARVELEIVFNTLFRRLPDMRLTKPFDELSYKFRGLAFGIHDLEIAW